MIIGLLTAVFVIVAFLLIFVILIQSGKGGGLAGIAGGSMSSVFGGQGSAPLLTKATTILATVFMLIALLLGMMTRGTVDENTILQRERERRMASPARSLPEVAAPAESTPAPTE